MTELPEAPTQSAGPPPCKAAMPPPHQPSASPANGASSTIWPVNGSNGVPVLENGRKTAVHAPDVVMKEASEQAPPAEGTSPPAERLPVLDAGPAQPAPASTQRKMASVGSMPGHAGQDSRAEGLRPGGTLTAAQQAAIADLEGILARISALDPEGWFQHPVTEADAPNYHSIIKHPMCFQVRHCDLRSVLPPPMCFIVPCPHVSHPPPLHPLHADHA